MWLAVINWNHTWTQHVAFKVQGGKRCVELSSQKNKSNGCHNILGQGIEREEKGAGMRSQSTSRTQFHGTDTIRNWNTYAFHVKQGEQCIRSTCNICLSRQHSILFYQHAVFTTRSMIRPMLGHQFYQPLPGAPYPALYACWFVGDHQANDLAAYGTSCSFK